MNALYCGLVCWLVTHTVTTSLLFAPLRRLRGHVGYLFSCPLCFGTWVGLVLGLLVPGPLGNRLLDGLLYAAVGYALSHVTNLIEAARG